MGEKYDGIRGVWNPQEKSLYLLICTFSLFLTSLIFFSCIFLNLSITPWRCKILKDGKQNRHTKSRWSSYHEGFYFFGQRDMVYYSFSYSIFSFFFRPLSYCFDPSIVRWNLLNHDRFGRGCYLNAFRLMKAIDNDVSYLRYGLSSSSSSPPSRWSSSGCYPLLLCSSSLRCHRLTSFG